MYVLINNEKKNVRLSRVFGDAELYFFYYEFYITRNKY